MADHFIEDFCAQATQIARSAGGSLPASDDVGKFVAAGHWMRWARRVIEALVQALAAERKVEPHVIRQEFGIDPP